jgi:hypothetical protein
MGRHLGILRMLLAIEILLHLVSLLKRVSRRRSPVWVAPRIHLVILVVLVVVICGYNSLDAANGQKEREPVVEGIGTECGKREEERGGNNAKMRAPANWMAASSIYHVARST